VMAKMKFIHFNTGTVAVSEIAFVNRSPLKPLSVEVAMKSGVTFQIDNKTSEEAEKALKEIIKIWTGD